MEKVILYVHGKGGSHLEAASYEKSCPGFAVIGVDYEIDYPWLVKEQLKAAYSKLREKYGCVLLLANSIGAYLSMYALQGCSLDKSLLISPILDMERLILDMLRQADISEQELCEKEEILDTATGEVLSWRYLRFVRDNPLVWTVPTHILYAGNDALTSRQTVDAFVQSHNARLTVLENGEHWFHTEEQLAFLNEWLKNALAT